MLQNRAREKERGGEISREREGEGKHITALNNKARADTQKKINARVLRSREEVDIQRESEEK